MSDPRSTLANDRVAHESLRGQVEVPRFVSGTRMRVGVPVLDLCRTATRTAPERQLLRGEPFLELERDGATAFGRADLSGYVGYVDAAALAPWQAPTHRVAARETLLFSQADFKTPGPEPLSLGSCLRIVGQKGRFLLTEAGGFVPGVHLKPLETPETDPVLVAERLIGTPYLWGGNSAFGIDCSGLIQIGLQACGVVCPGDSDQQQRDLGVALPEGAAPRRGDLLFWAGHVAWVMDEQTLIHANAYHMAVQVESLAGAIQRISDQGDGPVTAHKRI